MEDQYGMLDLRHYLTGKPLFRPIHHPPDFLPDHRLLHPSTPPYGGMLMFSSDSNSSATTGGTTLPSAAAGSSRSQLIAFDGGANGGSPSSSSGRWPRQETLTLLEIRSRLDSKFKEANQKGPLWDQVSRIMSEENGYHRSGKKCREKFENLYKYYKKTKEGKAGRQDGKHYRFFTQLEAIYGKPYRHSSSPSMLITPLGATFHCQIPTNNTSSRNIEALQGSKLSDTSLSHSNYLDAETSSSGDIDPNEGIEDGDGDNDPKGKKIRGWKAKIRAFIDAQMKDVMDKQEAWMEKMMRTIEEKEQERVLREDEWRKQDVARIERERELWSTERAWIKARDWALIEALQEMTAGNDQSRNRARASDSGEIMPEIRGLSENHHNDFINNFLHKKMIEFCSKGGAYRSILESIPTQGGLNSSNTRDQIGFDHDHPTRVFERDRNYDCSDLPPPDGDTGGGAAAISDHCFRYLMGDCFTRILD
ncbi:trihelix transcription factor PTL-like [Andrographis paniculata]|uniref:trihelix transcription factor PTL-like n=1 Tax=Andrographis paniculata TaxID=175694 RepID=UPI0021E77911|nr:trihelix transcription factor PTL-like [Andrographis paniculata]